MYIIIIIIIIIIVVNRRESYRDVSEISISRRITDWLTDSYSHPSDES